MRIGRRAVKKLLGRIGPVVLVYHRIADLPVDPWGMCVSPAHFAEHVDILRRYACPLQATSLVARVAARAAPRHAVAVTFDDGYADLLLAARPLLERAAVPATMFVTTGAIGAPEEFWWDAVERALLYATHLPPRLRLPLGNVTGEWSLEEDGGEPVCANSWPQWRGWDPPPSSRHAVCAAVWQALLGLGTADRNRAVAELLAWAGLTAAARPSHRTLLEPELDALAAGNLIEIGAHTVTHPVLAALSVAEQHAEITLSRQTLCARLQRDVAAFAYPFGKAEHLGPATAGAVRAAGFSTAFLNVAGNVSRRTDRYAVPRISVKDVDGEAFGRLLRRYAGIRIG